MNIAAVLRHDLIELSDATGIDHRRSLDRLALELVGAIPSYLGLSITLVADGHHVTFTVIREGHELIEPQTSLHLAVDVGSLEPAPSITLYASAPGALAHLAGNLDRPESGPGPRPVLDQHLRALSADDASGLAAFSTVNQAVGVLMASGVDAAAAYAELDSRAERSGRSRLEIARVILPP